MTLYILNLFALCFTLYALDMGARGWNIVNIAAIVAA